MQSAINAQHIDGRPRKHRHDVDILQGMGLWSLSGVGCLAPTDPKGQFQVFSTPDLHARVVRSNIEEVSPVDSKEAANHCRCPVNSKGQKQVLQTYNSSTLDRSRTKGETQQVLQTYILSTPDKVRTKGQTQQVLLTYISSTPEGCYQ